MKRRRLKLTSRFLVAIISGVALVSAVMALLTYHQAQGFLLASSKGRLRETVRAQALALAGELGRVEERVEALSASLKSIRQGDREALQDLMRLNLLDSPRIYGMAVAFAPNAFSLEKRLYAPYVYRSDQGPVFLYLDHPDYNYPIWDWYLIPALTGRKVWSEPYFDQGGGGILMTTLSVPVNDQAGLLAVVTADVALNNLGREVAGLKLGPGQEAFVLSRLGTFLAADQKDLVMNHTVFSLAEKLGRPELRQIGQRMVAGQSELVRIQSFSDNRPAFLAFHPVKGLGWSFASLVPEDEVLSPVKRLAHSHALMTLGGLMLIAAVVTLLLTGLTRPLRRLAAGARRLATGDFSTRVEGVPPGDELGDMAQTFNQMVGELNRHIDELTKATAAKERLASELDLARRIQDSILPHSYPALPQCPQVDLFGRTLPAREVGGDFYDYFMVDSDHLGLVVGDVSGKGVPSALFMTVSRTLIRNAAGHHLDPAQTVQEVNRQIVPDNEMCMFVTLFYGVYEIKSGRLSYVTAGHQPPLLRGADGRVTSLPPTGGMAVGVAPMPELAGKEIELEPGQLLLVFTDGLEEAVDEKQRMFGLERVRAWLGRQKDEPAPQLIENLLQTHRAYTGDREQFDDLTLLIFRRLE